MDVAQLAQMVNWLDEEHRRDRAEIARLQQRVESQSADIIEQARRIQELEARQAGKQDDFAKFGQLEHAIQNAKQELSSLVERGETARVQMQRELERGRLTDREVLSREISEVRRELPRIGRLEEALGNRATEDERLGELIMGVRNQLGTLAKDIEERTRQIPFLSEQRTSDTRRIAQLQQETVELFKRIEAVGGRIPLLEEGIKSVNTEVEKWPPVVETQRDQQAKFMEEVRSTIVDREQVLTRWQETIEEQKSVVNQAYERVQSFAQQIDIGRRSVHEMQEFKDLILRELSQVKELQRLAEDRLRRAMDEFSEEYDKKRRKGELHQDHVWSEQEKYNREVVEKFPPILHDIKVLETLVQQVWKLQEGYSSHLFGAAQSWMDGWQNSLNERDENLRTMEDDWQRRIRNTELYANQGNTRRPPGITTGELADSSQDGAG